MFNMMMASQDVDPANVSVARMLDVVAAEALEQAVMGVVACAAIQALAPFNGGLVGVCPARCGTRRT